MTIIVFSDIHGNIYSLEKAIKLMQKYKSEHYIFLGDMAGYYYYQNECIELLNTLPNLVSIKGNHDDMFLKSLSDERLLEDLEGKYGKSYKILRNNISYKSLNYLKGMKDFEKNELYEAYHASPNNYLSEYIYPDNKSLILDKDSAPYIFLGHTHYQMDKYINNVRVINPGSIGQPRDINKPSFCIIDTDSDKLEFVRYDYDKTKLLEDISLKNDNLYLASVLRR